MNRRRDLWVLGGLLPAVLLVQGWNITGYPAISADEGTYLAQARAVAAGEGLAHYTYWYDHPPFGWMQLAVLGWLPEVLAPDTLRVPAARVIMLLVSAINLSLVFTLARRLRQPRWAAGLAVLLFGLCPLGVALARQIYLDNIGLAWILGAMALALCPRRDLWHHCAAGACAALSVLSKETMFLLLPAALVAVWQGTHASTRKFCVVAFGCGFVFTVAFYPLYALLKGELLPGRDHVSLLGAVGFQLFGRDGSGSVFAQASDASRTVDSWLYQDGVLIVAGLAALLVAVFFRRLWVPAAALAVLTIALLRPGGYLPSMYIAQALPFLALLVSGCTALLIGWLLDQRIRRPGWARFTRRTLVITLACWAIAGISPLWWHRDARAMTVQANSSYSECLRWITESVPADSRIVVDDGLWLDLSDRGYHAIWFYKVDLDPEVRVQLPRGWRDVDYVVSSPMMRYGPERLPTVDDALRHSRIVATFGAGSDRIEVRKVSRYREGVTR
ncbi:hypothetical protein D5S17_09915 [Pseudonocardiaceae bacterium YIM PH 21723]|nr:hypothetical protein D5S17_09915 [Pseudonocardiaceae bacterium YIM PH 21723]